MDFMNRLSARLYAAPAPLLGLVLGALATPGLAAAMYKWVDADGQVNYTQSPPPPGIEAETVKPPPPPANPEEARKQLDNRQELLEGRRDERQEQAQKQAGLAEETAWYEENCKRARQSLSAYSVPNALIAQADGSRTRITEEARLAGLKDAGERVKEYCK